MKTLKLYALLLMPDHLEMLHPFRRGIYERFPYRRDSLLGLVNASSRSDHTRSTVKLSLDSYLSQQ